MSTPDWRWFVRSLLDADTHRGHYSPATRSVHTVCGLEFQAPGYLLDGLPGEPPDPQQVCPTCRARQGR
ncbi:MAG: hypothetical protein ACRDQV_15820 [Pseudonocardiaceae bacterium]